ncbi:MAG: hypothetical protein K0R18_1247 [Bacillales bacterium]|jgi:hypothetical protein|nr:hypothetical protein [Bacillales bacterium]
MTLYFKKVSHQIKELFQEILRHGDGSNVRENLHKLYLFLKLSSARTEIHDK